VDQGGGTTLHWIDVWVPRVAAHLHELLHRLSVVNVQTMLAVHTGLVASACWLAFSRGRWKTLLAWIAVVAFSLTWFGVNNRWEGRILYTVAPTHGLTEADLMAPALIAAALVIRGLRYLGRAWRERRAQRRAQGVPTVLQTMWPKW
jgi:hypothetical protein